ncbi:CHAD domain-containing protein, partial [Streptomyces tendae]
MSDNQLRIVWIYPDLLSTYGDQGNALVVERRARQRGLDVARLDVRSDQPIPTSGDIYLVGGGEDRPQRLAAERLRRDGGLYRAVENGAIVFSVCAGYQILGHEFINDLGQREPGLGLLDRRVTDPVRAELKWLAGELGTARDQEVLRERLGAGLDGLPGDLVLGPVAARLRAWEVSRGVDVRSRTREALDAPRYLRLLDALDALVDGPPLRAKAAGKPDTRPRPRGPRRPRSPWRRRCPRCAPRACVGIH